MTSKAVLSLAIGISVVSRVSAITIGFGTVLTGAQDTQSDGASNQMRQNINITNTVFLDEGTYHATTWSYQAGPDSVTAGVTQPVFPFLTIVKGPANHTVLAFGATIDTEPGTQTGVPFGGTNDTFVIPPGGATVAAGIQNPSAPGVQNSILTDVSFGLTDHANSGNFDEAGSVGATLDSFGHANLARTYAFSIEVEAGLTPDGDNDTLPDAWETDHGLDPNDDGTTGESAPGLKDGPNGALGDPDGDGLSNAEEFARGADPQNPDSDGDTINDGDEVSAGTNPTKADSDNDGLDDAEEIIHGTDPNNPDSDGDRRRDGQEIAQGSDPNDPNSPSTIMIGFGTILNGVQDTPAADSGANQMRQNINITNTVFLPAGTYHAKAWDYRAALDSTVPGVTQPVFPFLTIVNGPANHTVIAFGDTIDTDPGIQFGVPFGDENDTFIIPQGGATVAAGIQNPSAAGVQNSIFTDTSFGSTDHANSLNFNEAGSVGASLLNFGHANLARTYAFSIDVVTGSGDQKIPLSIARSGPDLLFEWGSKPGMFYNLKTTTDLSSDPATWDSVEVDGVFDIPSTPPLNVHSIPRPADAIRFYRVEEYAVPPVTIFVEHFDGADPGWTTGFNAADTAMNTAWQLGDPFGGPSTGPPNAKSGPNCYGTNLLANYGISSNTWLRTPSIDLTAAPAASVVFQHWVDMDEFQNLDAGTVRVLDASLLPGVVTELGVVRANITGLGAADWVEFSAELPAAALGHVIALEFLFVSDGDDIFDASGWYIDDVMVTTPAP